MVANQMTTRERVDLLAKCLLHPFLSHLFIQSIQEQIQVRVVVEIIGLDKWGKGNKKQ